MCLPSDKTEMILSDVKITTTTVKILIKNTCAALKRALLGSYFIKEHGMRKTE